MAKKLEGSITVLLTVPAYDLNEQEVTDDRLKKMVKQVADPWSYGETLHEGYAIARDVQATAFVTNTTELAEWKADLESYLQETFAPEDELDLYIALWVEELNAHLPLSRDGAGWVIHDDNVQIKE